MHSRMYLRGCAVGLAALVCCNPASARDLYPSQFYLASNAPAAVVIADVNGDGFPDVVELGTNQTVAVFLNRGDGTFHSPEDYYVAGSTPLAMAVADLNHDGRPDIVVVNEGDATVSVLLNKGNGVFAAEDIAEQTAGTGTPAPTYAIGKGAESVTIGDVNGDGIPDIITTNYSDDTISVLLGRGNGTFLSQTTYTVGNGPAAVAIADVNNDGKPDLIVANSTDNTFEVLLNNGHGTFRAQTVTRIGAPSRVGTLQTLLAADFDHDGKVDIVATTTNPAVNAVVFFHGNGNGTFRTGQAIPAGNQVRYLQAADVNGDGNLDLVAGSASNSTLRVLFGDGSGGFTGSLDYPAPGMNGSFGAQGFALADIDGDGHPDVVADNPDGGFIQVLRNDGSGGFHVANSYSLGNAPSDVATADLDGDGHMDIVEVNAADNTLGVRLGNGDGTFQALQTYPVGSHPQRVVLADVNGDGKLDAVTANYQDGTVSVLLGNGNGTFQPALSFSAGANPVDLAVADMTHDGRLDIVVANSIVNTVSVLKNQGNDSSGNPQFRAPASTPAHTELDAIAVGDIDRDGFPDVVAVGSTVAVLHNNFGDGFKKFVFDANGDGGSIDIYTARGLRAILADVNHDGNPDLLITDYGGNQLAVLIGNSKGYFDRNNIRDYPTCANPDALAAADLNGDGNVDMVVGCGGSSTVGVMLGNGSGGFISSAYPAEIDPRAVAIADFDGDGLPDIAAVNGGSNDVNVLLQVRGAVSSDRAPVAKSTTFTVADGRNPASGGFSASDGDDGRLTYVMLQPPFGGSLSYVSSTGSFTYTANTGFIGKDSATFQVSDGAKISNIATLTIDVQNNAAGQSSHHGGLGGFGWSLLPALLALLTRRRRA